MTPPMIPPPMTLTPTPKTPPATPTSRTQPGPPCKPSKPPQDNKQPTAHAQLTDINYKLSAVANNPALAGEYDTLVAARGGEEGGGGEEKIQNALRKMGKCVAGYEWTKVEGGYLCAGGSHFVDDGEVKNYLFA